MTKVVSLRLGSFMWDDELVHAGEPLGGFVDLLDDLGRRVDTVHLVDALAAAQTIVRPEQEFADVHYIRENLLPIGLRKFDEDLPDVRLILTGYRSGVEDGSQPVDGFDRQEKNLAARVRAVAAIRCKRPQVYKRDGEFRKPRTMGGEIKLLQRLIARYRVDNLTGIIDRRYRKARRDRQDPRIAEAIERIVVDARSGSTLRMSSHIRTLRRAFIGWANPPKIPCENTLRKMFKAAESGNPLTTGSAASRRSIANIPDVSSVLRQAFRVGELVVGDTYIIDLPVVDPVTREVFRPQLTMLLDIGCRGVAGWSMTYETDAFGVGVALGRSMQPRPMEKISEDDPERSTSPRLYVGTPDVLLVDNGKPFVADYTTTVAAQNGVSLEAVRAFTPTDKAIIERMFLTIIDLFLQQFASYLGGSIYARGGSPFKDIVMTLDLFEDRFQHFIDEIYHHRSHSGLVYPGTAIKDLSPYQAWTLLTEEYGAPRTSSWTHEWVRLLPFETRKITREGVQMKYLRYNSPELAELSKHRGTEPDGSFVFHYHPADLRQIYTIDAEGRLYTIPWRFARSYSPAFGRHTLEKIRRLCPSAKTEAEIEQALVDMAFRAITEDEHELSMLGTKTRENVDMHNVEILKANNFDSAPYVVDMLVGTMPTGRTVGVVEPISSPAAPPVVLTPEKAPGRHYAPAAKAKASLTTVNFGAFRDRPERRS